MTITHLRLWGLCFLFVGWATLSGCGQPASTVNDTAEGEVPSGEVPGMDEPHNEPVAEEPAAESESAPSEAAPAEEDAAPEGDASQPAEEPSEDVPAEATTDQAAGEWGDLKGRIVFDGTPAEAAKLTITKDQEFCGKHDLRDETLVVGEDGGVANAVIYLYLGRGDEAPAAHPSYAETANGEVHLDNVNCRFTPRICLLQTTQTLVVGNPDPVGHNTKVDTFSNDGINPLVPAGGTFEVQFPLPERGPVPVSCSIHPWMNAYLLIRDNPYFAVSNEKGEFEIKNLPVGDWTIQFWHEKPGNLSEVTLGGQPTEWTRGRAELSIKAGINDLGEIKLSPEVFAD